MLLRIQQLKTTERRYRGFNQMDRVDQVLRCLELACVMQRQRRAAHPPPTHLDGLRTDQASAERNEGCHWPRATQAPGELAVH
ncbi:hypothetical protein D3C75_1042360 [compost metagenome]